MPANKAPPSEAGTRSPSPRPRPGAPGCGPIADPCRPGSGAPSIRALAERGASLLAVLPRRPSSGRCVLSRAGHRTSHHPIDALAVERHDPEAPALAIDLLVHVG